jgi:hypothetical protein
MAHSYSPGLPELSSETIAKLTCGDREHSSAHRWMDCGSFERRSLAKSKHPCCSTGKLEIPNGFPDEAEKEWDWRRISARINDGNETVRGEPGKTLPSHLVQQATYSNVELRFGLIRS